MSEHRALYYAGALIATAAVFAALPFWAALVCVGLGAVLALELGARNE